MRSANVVRILELPMPAAAAFPDRLAHAWPGAPGVGDSAGT